MRVTIRPVDDHGATVSLNTVPIRWEPKTRRFLMLRAIGDGFYDTWPDTPVTPVSVVADGDELIVEVTSTADAAQLAADLKSLSAFCFDSYGESRT